MTDYRYPNESLILALTLLLVAGVIVFTSVATLCGSALFILAMVGLGYWLNDRHHAALLRQAQPVTAETIPALDTLIQRTARRLDVRGARTFAAPGRTLNAYTFGLSDPKVIVLFTGLLRALDRDELQFVVGHEMGHIRLGHTWLNSLIGGMAGIPSPYAAAALLYFAFRWWNRACEFSADRAGLLACGRLDKAISALVKIATGGAAQSAISQERALAVLDRQDEDLGSLVGEALSTHPLIARRVDELRKFAASDECRRLQARIDQAAGPG
jgi:Zn-dependent protease with chaperone function